MKPVMQISSEELMSCVMRNDVKKLRKVLSSFGIERTGTKVFFDDDRLMLDLLVMYASIRAKTDNLDEEFATELIERVAPLVDIFGYLGALLLYTDYQPKRDTNIPKNLIKELHQQQPSDAIYSMIQNLSRDQYLLLATYITGGDFSTINSKIVAPLLLFAYNKCVVSPDVGLSYMANCFVGVDDVLHIEEIFGDDDEISLSDLYDELEDPNHKPF